MLLNSDPESKPGLVKGWAAGSSRSQTFLSSFLSPFSSSLQINNGGRVMRPLGALRTRDEKETWPHTMSKTRGTRRSNGPAASLGGL